MKAISFFTRTHTVSLLPSHWSLTPMRATLVSMSTRSIIKSYPSKSVLLARRQRAGIRPRSEEGFWVHVQRDAHDEHLLEKLILREHYFSIKRNSTKGFSWSDLVRCSLSNQPHLFYGCTVSSVQRLTFFPNLLSEYPQAMSLRSFESSKDLSEDCLKVLVENLLVVHWQSYLMDLQNYDIVKKLDGGVLLGVYLATCKRGRLKRRSVVLKKVLFLVDLCSFLYRRSPGSRNRQSFGFCCCTPGLMSPDPSVAVLHIFRYRSRC